MLLDGNEFRLRISFRESPKKYLHIVLEGKLSADNGSEIEGMVLKLISQHEVEGLLIDVRGFQGRGGLMEAYERPQHWSRIGVPTAIVDREEHADHNNFLVATARNAGFPHYWSSDPLASQDWLEAKISQPSI